MDCETARQCLEARRHDDVEQEDPLPAGLAEHLAQCTTCRAAQHSMALLDRLIGTRVRNVAVPEGLKARLLDRVAAATLVADGSSAQHCEVLRDGDQSAAPGCATTAKRQQGLRQSGRRRWWVGAAAGWAAAAALLFVWHFARAPRWTQPELETLVRTAAFDALEEPAEAPAVHPSQFRKAALVREGVKVLDGRRITVLHYQVGVAGAVVECEVYVIPEAMISGTIPPFSRKASVTTGGMTVASWQEGRHVFVFVSRQAGGEDVLRLFQRTDQMT